MSDAHRWEVGGTEGVGRWCLRAQHYLAEDFAVVGVLRGDCPPSVEMAEEQKKAALEAADQIRELRKDFTLDRPEGMSLREYAHIGHKY